MVAKWFRDEGEPKDERARALRRRFEAGGLEVVAPPLLALELLNAAARRWGWDEHALTGLANALGGLGFVFVPPDLRAVASWSARGLSAYDACYVAVAEARAIPLVTDDSLILTLAPAVATAL